MPLGFFFTGDGFWTSVVTIFFFFIFFIVLSERIIKIYISNKLIYSKNIFVFHIEISSKTIETCFRGIS